MYYSDFKIDDNMEEATEIILGNTNKKIEEIKNMISEDITNTMYEDIEEWLYERFDNVKRQYFNEVVKFLLGESNNEKLEKWLTSLSYDQTKFRKKIYNDNKEVINQAIASDSVFEILENMFKSSHFRCWEFSDITTGYPQTDIVKGFLRELIKKDGFNAELKNILNKEIQNKMTQLKELQQEINNIKGKIDELI